MRLKQGSTVKTLFATLTARYPMRSTAKPTTHPHVRGEMMGRRGCTVFSAVGLALLAFFGLPGTAHASRTTCELDYPDDWVCSTGTLRANPKYHALLMHAVAWSAEEVVCIVWDQHNWAEVGRIRTKREEWKVIHGLYGVYAMGCYTTHRDGSAEGYIGNNDIDITWRLW